MFKHKKGLIPVIILLISSVSFIYSQEVQTVQPDTLVVAPVPTIEVIPSVDGETIKARLEKIQSTVPLKYNQYVHSFVDFFTYRKPSFTKTMLERKNYFFPIFEEHLKKYGIPDEIKYLSLIESGLNPKAISYAGAAGLWQFMPKTGRIDFGLRIDKFVDERHHVVKSTEAACKYMRQLYRIFGDWELVLAAYNTGPGNVRRAIRRAGGGGFWEIYPFLHKQTRSYVPQYVAMIYMMHHAADYNIVADRDEIIPESSPIMVSNYLNLTTLASLSHIDFEDFQKVNPHIISTELPENTKDFVLSIPTNCYSFFDENRQAILDSASKRISPKLKGSTNGFDNLDTTILADNTKKSSRKSKIAEVEAEEETKAIANENGPDDFEEVAKRKPTIKYHTIKKGENLNQIAHKYGVDMFDIKVWNNIKKSNDIKYGRKIKLYLENAPIKAEYFAKNSRKIEDKNAEVVERSESATKSPTKKQIHIVRKGENLFQIAEKYDLDIKDLKDLNNLKNSNNIRAGQKLKLSEGKATLQLASNNEDKIDEKSSRKIKPKFHIVNKGDTIWSIAQRYEGTTVEKIRKLNDIRTNNLKPGQKLRVS
ncbi:MAG: LysM peptidoglycan-binding domain-containing protein [Bacteroidota bacterium]